MLISTRVEFRVSRLESGTRLSVDAAGVEVACAELMMRAAFVGVGS